MDRTLLVLGAGGHGKVVADCALSSGSWDSVAFLDDRYPGIDKVRHWPIIGKVSELENYVSQYPSMALGVGANYEALRLNWIERGLKVGVSFPPIIHSGAVCSPYSIVGSGSVVFAGAAINIDVDIGKACIINTNASVDHDCCIGDGTHISPAASLAGGVRTGQKCWIGMGAQVIQGVTIGDLAVVGAGAVVLGNVESRNTVIGIPAKPVNKKVNNSDCNI